MKVCGIICEYNPFHTGHKYQIDILKDMGYSVVCLMSGSFVERGKPAFFDKSVRAELAIKSGADLVLELPFPFSSFGAERFARAGVSILSSIGICDSVCFGSECGDIALLSGAVDALLSQELNDKIEALMVSDRSLGFARARGQALQQALGYDFSTPNDILAIEYLKALRVLHSSMTPIAIKRNGAGFYSAPKDGYASASYLRQLITEGHLEETLEFVPNASLSELKKCIKIDPQKHYCAFCSAVLTMGVEGLSRIAEINGGMEYSVYNAVLEQSSIADIEKCLASKHLTSSKIRRMLLFALMGITQDNMQEAPAYTRVIAVGEKGYELLKASKSAIADDFTLISGASHLAKASKQAKRQYEQNAKAERILNIIKI